MTEHLLRLQGPGVRGRRVSAALLRDLLDALVDGVRQSVRLGVDGRSTAQGHAPAWLDAAASFDLVEVREGSTELVLQAAPLASAAPDRFKQTEMFAAVDPAANCLDVFELSLADALGARGDSDRFDDQLVGTFESFGRVFRHGVESLELGARGACRIDRAALDTFRKLRREIPPARRVVVAGKLDVLRHSDRVFTLVLDSGAIVRAVVASDEIDLRALGELWGRTARISGLAAFRPSGALLRVDADRIEAAVGDTSLWSRMPTPLSQELDTRALHRPQGPRSGVNAIFGQWPGDESDDDLLRMLGELS
jgi:hypothetical protein